MSGLQKRASLAADIATALGTGKARLGALRDSEIPSRFLLVTGVALAIMQSQPANAVALGDLRVQSGLGQPFVGTTTARLGPGETIASGCITTPGKGGDGLSTPDGLRVSAQNGATPGSYPVQIRTTQPLYEPMYEIRLQIDCPGGVALSKSYVVMLNLPMMSSVETSSAAKAATSASSIEPIKPTRARTNRGPQKSPSVNRTRLSPSGASIPAGQPYRVRNGDSLSAIAERIEGRPVGSTWRVAEMLFAANPQAFMRGNRDLLKLGAVIDVPGVAALAGKTASPSETKPVSAIALSGEQPTATGNELLNVELGRPEEDAAASNAASEQLLDDQMVDNEQLLREIREATAAENASPFADESSPSPVASETELATDDVNVGSDGAPINDSQAIEQQPSGMSPLVAVVAGIFMGVLLALLMLGRNIFGPLLEGRARRQAALQPKAAPGAAMPKPAEKMVEVAPTHNSADAGAPPAAATYGGGGIDVEVGAPSDASMATGNAPRVSLRPENNNPADTTHIDNLFDDAADADADKTERFEAPALNSPLDDTAQEAAGGLSDSETMRTLFEENVHAPTVDMPEPDSEGETVEMANESESATAELPAVDASHADIDITDLESLSRKLQETQDDKLSATLTQALGLLEQDYEEEMTASQILEKREVDEAFSQHKSED